MRALRCAGSPASKRWADHAGKVCAAWFPISCRFLATDRWTRPKEIVVVFRPELHDAGAPALTSGNRTEFSAQWIAEHPDDFGMVIHELTHVI